MRTAGGRRTLSAPESVLGLPAAGSGKEGADVSSQVISARGNRAAAAVALMRILGSAGMGAVLVVLGSVLGEYADCAVFGKCLSSPAAFTGVRIAAVAGGLLLAVLSSCGEIFLGGRAARSEEIRIRHRLLASLYASDKMALRDSAEFSPARLVTLMTDNAERVTEYRQAYLGSTLASFLIPFFVLGYVALAVDPVSGTVLMAAFVSVPLTVGGFLRLFGGRSKASRGQRARLSAKYLDAIRNLVSVRLLGAGKTVERDLREEGERNRGTVMRLLAGNQIIIAVLDGAVSFLVIILASMLAALRVRAGIMDFGAAFTVIFLIVLVLSPLSQVAGFFYVGMGGIAAQKAIKRYLDAHGEGNAAAEKYAVRNAADPLPPAAGADFAVEVRGLSFAYRGKNVLNGLDLSVPRGQKVAVIGVSGAGKSTLLSVLRAQLPFTEGMVRVGGVDFSSAPAAEKRSLCACVNQKTWLFGGTVADNLRFVCPDAGEGQMWDALERANIAEEVRAMPLRLNTDVGERGSFLSGGQAQRISLARAFLAQRKIWFLDEPTAQVDPDSERKITAALARAGRDITVVAVTHRHSLLHIADVVYELTDGRLIRRENAYGEE